MKIRNVIILISVFIVSLKPLSVSAQCEDETFVDNCASLLDTYVYIKTFNIEHSKQSQESEYSYVFCKGASYVITVCDPKSGDDKLIVELYDKEKKFVASNYNSKTNKFYPKIGYPCSATGVYYMKYKFKSGKPACGISMIGFKK